LTRYGSSGTATRPGSFVLTRLPFASPDERYWSAERREAFRAGCASAGYSG